jgi:chromatin structure-remodeling complex subunit RSC3/30
MASIRCDGQLSSCEPCRKSKFQCDHSSPICTRCIRRGKSDSCVYHPAPLTRLREWRKSPKVGNASLRDSEIASKYEYDWVYLAPYAAIYRLGTGRPNCGKRPSSNPGFLGLTSYSGAFSEHAGFIESETNQSAELVTRDAALSNSATALIESRQLELGAQVLSSLLVVGPPFPLWRHHRKTICPV